MGIPDIGHRRPPLPLTGHVTQPNCGPKNRLLCAAHELMTWSSDNRMNVNSRKTKEIVLGPLASNKQLNNGNLTVDTVTVQGARSYSHQPVTEMERTPHKRLLQGKQTNSQQLKQVGMSTCDHICFSF